MIEFVLIENQCTKIIKNIKLSGSIIVVAVTNE